MNRLTENDYLKSAAAAVEKQVVDNPGLGIPADPDVAEFMGAFEEEAVTLDDVLDSLLDDGEE